MKVYPITFGCKVNQYETQALLSQLERCGYSVADRETDGDVIVVNSCTVTGVSDQKVRQALHRARRLRPDAVIVLTGCMPQAFPEESAALFEADIVVGNADRARLPELLERFLRTRRRTVSIRPHQTGDVFEPMQVSGFRNRTRAFLKIEDGCNRFCSYCIIPYARGRVRSKPLQELRQEIGRLEAQGYQEVVLVGINLSAFGQDTGHSLCDAVECACAYPGIRRVRLGSLEPDYLDDETLRRLSRQEKLCPQFHLSLQSGCDDTLKRMNRHYTSGEYEALVQKIRAAFPGASLTTDVMVGFPGETEREFDESLAFVEKIGFGKVHVFSYSVRPGTAAAARPDQISPAVKEARSRSMISAAAAARGRFLTEQVGQVCDVLFETVSEDGYASGYTKNYTPVRVRSGRTLQNRLVPVRLTGCDGDGCIGELVSDAP